MSGFALLRFLSFSWRDAFEIVLVAVVIYRLLLLFEGTRAVQMLAGIMVLVVAYAAAWMFKLTMITYLFGILFTYGAFAAARALPAGTARGARASRTIARRCDCCAAARRRRRRRSITDAVERLARTGTGALIAVERGVRLGDYAQTGTPVLARVSADLLETIFTPRSPLHDGAVIIRGDTIIGAGCILPAHEERSRRPHAGHAPPRRARPERGDRRAGDHRERGDAQVSVAEQGGCGAACTAR